MSEKLCLQWNDFKENVNFAFGRLREDKEFTDVTLACEDGQQVEAHKVILAASSPFFEKIFERNKHTHPLIYLRGFKLYDLVAILDFLYFGEANVCQENLDSFLLIAEELKLKGLTRQTSCDFLGKDERKLGLSNKNKESLKKLTPNKNGDSSALVPNAIEGNSQAFAIQNQFSNDDLEALDAKVKSLMERSLNRISHGKRANGNLKYEKASICKICGKEGRYHLIIQHIETNHLDGISISCHLCDKAFSSRHGLEKHTSKIHNN